MKNPAIKYFEKATGYKENNLEFFFEVFPKFSQEFAWMDDTTKISEFRRRNNVNVYTTPTGAMVISGKKDFRHPLRLSLCMLDKTGFANLKLVKFLMEYHSFNANDALYYLFKKNDTISRKTFDVYLSSLVPSWAYVNRENSEHEGLRQGRSMFLNSEINYKQAYERIETLNCLVIQKAHRLQNDFETILKDIDKDIRSI